VRNRPRGSVDVVSTRRRDVAGARVTRRAHDPASFERDKEALAMPVFLPRPV
jgi:hypothetical protein